jgi:hypothetical protein
MDVWKLVTVSVIGSIDTCSLMGNLSHPGKSWRVCDCSVRHRRKVQITLHFSVLPCCGVLNDLDGSYIHIRKYVEWGTQRSWFRFYATNRKVTGSIPNDIIESFSWPNSFSRTMALESTQPVTEMSTRSLPGGKVAVGAYGWQRHHHLRAECLENVGASTSHSFMGLHGLL